MKLCIKQSIAVLVILLCSTTVYPINLKYIKDTDWVLEQNFRHLSPVHGAIWWRKLLIRNLYDFGFYGKNILKTKKGFPSKPYGTIQLIRYLFHEVQGSFNRTYNVSSTAYHFSAKTIAKIFAVIEEYKNKVGFQAMLELANKLVSVIKEDDDFQKSIESFREKYDTLKKQVVNMQEKKIELEKNRKEFVVLKKQVVEQKNDNLEKALDEKIAAIDRKLDPIKELEKKRAYYDIKMAQGRRVKALTKAIAVSLGECGYLQLTKKGRSTYPPFTTHTILLAFLYRKVEKKSEFRDYFYALENKLNQKILTEQGAISVAANSWVTDTYDDSNDAIEEQLNQIKVTVEKQPKMENGANKDLKNSDGETVLEFMLNNKELKDNNCLTNCEAHKLCIKYLNNNCSK